MTRTRPGLRPEHASGFHDGERAVQARAGLTAEAARLEGMLAPAALSAGAAGFLASQRFAVMAGHDRDQTLWASPLVGPPGFLQGEPATLTVRTLPGREDPLHGLAAGQLAAVIAVDLLRRRRVRVNGWLGSMGSAGFGLEIQEAYGNCPAYIQQRAVRHELVTRGEERRSAVHGDALSGEAIRLIRGADTLFVASRHPTRGTDISHKGGNPGFVRIEGADILWPDYAGNNMFNTLGNLSSDPAAGLLFIDFETGTVVQLSGTAAVEWRTPGEPGGDADTGRWVRFQTARGLVRESGIRGGHVTRKPTPAGLAGAPDADVVERRRSVTPVGRTTRASRPKSSPASPRRTAVVRFDVSPEPLAVSDVSRDGRHDTAIDGAGRDRTSPVG